MFSPSNGSLNIVIPEIFVKKANLLNAEIGFEVVENGLLLKPIFKTTRDNWEEKIKNVLVKNQGLKEDNVFKEFFNDIDLEEYVW